MVNKQLNLTFFSKLQGALNSSFILFEKKLEEVLYSLAESPVVYQIVERCVKNYEYSTEKTNYLILPSIERNGSFSCPADRRECIAFICNLLYEIYDKKIIFTDLLDLHFIGNGYKEKFEDFKQKVLAKLYLELNSVLDDMDVLYNAKLDTKNEEIQQIITKKDKLKNYADNIKLKTEDQNYFNYFIDNALNRESLEICLKALEYILKNYKKGEEYLKEITEILNNNET